MIRLLICDDSEPFRTVLCTTLAEQPEIAVVGEAGDGQEAVDLALALSPDVILMDVRMPVIDGVEATRQITAALPSTRIVALTGSDDRAVVAAMLEAGATAYCVKGSPLSELERAVAGAAEPLVRLAHTLRSGGQRARRRRAGHRARWWRTDRRRRRCGLPRRSGRRAVARLAAGPAADVQLPARPRDRPRLLPQAPARRGGEHAPRRACSLRPPGRRGGGRATPR